MAQPKKFSTPNQMASVGVTRQVTAVITRPQKLTVRPRRRLFSFPQGQTKPEIRMKLQQMHCCQKNTWGSRYQSGFWP